jgi:GntR family transcriptional regulator, arabinose operon transcriptional repressor
MSKDSSKKETKHEKMHMWIKDRIVDGTFKIGDKLVSENELRSMFNVSRHTVRHALELLESEGIIDRRQGSGTYILKNPALNRKSTKCIGVSMSYLDEYIFPNILRGIDSVLTCLGYSIVLCITYNRVENERRFLNTCIANEVEGVIVEANKSALPNPNIDLYAELTAKGIPYVFINCFYDNMDCNYVVMDDYLGGFTAASRLLRSGHRKIGGIFKSDDMQGQRRYAGFAQALHKKGVNDFKDNIVWFSTEDIDILIDSKYDSELLNRLSGCTGIVCYNDQVAAKMIMMLQRNNISVPSDMSIVSFDNSNLAILCSVKLTTVTHAGEKLGEKAAESICQLITGSEKKIEYKFKPELVERDSVVDIKNLSAT